MTSLLHNKTSIIYGAGGGLGSGIALTFAREGATVFLAGRTRRSLERVAAQIEAAGGRAEVSVVDALDAAAVDEHVQAVVADAGGVDGSLNLISRGDVQGTPLIEMRVSDLMAPVTAGLRSNFLTARAAARQMVSQGSGVILSLTSGSSRGAAPLMGGTGPADAATEALMRYPKAFSPLYINMVKASEMSGGFSKMLDKIAGSTALEAGRDAVIVTILCDSADKYLSERFWREG